MSARRSFVASLAATLLASAPALADELPPLPPPSTSTSTSTSTPTPTPTSTSPSPSPSTSPSPSPSTSPSPSPSTPPSTSQHTRKSAVLLGGTSGVLAFSGAFLPVPSLYRYAFQLASAAPLLGSGDVDYAWNGGSQAVLVGSSGALRVATRREGDLASLWITSEELSLHQAFYSAYASYRDARARGSSAAWDDRWRPWTAQELALAPLQAKNLRPNVVAASLSVEGGLLGSFVGLNYLVGAPNHPRSAGKYARDLALGAVLAWDAGITEEAFFRGFYYEELKLSLGKWPARIIDMSTFTLAHVPGELGQNQSATSIYVGLATRALGGLLFEMAYDEGGLPTSVALHALWDVIAFTATSSLGLGPFGSNAVLPLASTTTAPRAGEAVLFPLYGGAF